ncbi:MAG: aldehyde dehydrogenase family protein [Candidatus Marinimicrobia bacterium]|jgi:acyl-CoA reductase-like NAD-dependent aldehyde dehydrogenase|nr:aldehyde dehydrogenase family protein [Candidatus Neomarinimicrobiota bacterium]MBT3840176.1 aldehyde dehydrogenase family protein [Candidatus Neomarinimicrobiota bacterium]MBT3999170.1 aldehyde dehydrogenase family protein [Candidatus Neomarinimicrobiota bacterium]MBT4282606.1 aldehyde dehydrogenase family protein [Candidatus Neomarinimicrobiota bacterium]MBT4579702.1 aldehyde dehydrogenase family protein [Candidatus Neomarinimicrobiota bacterium]
MSNNILQVVSPVDGSKYVERPYHTNNQIDSILTQAVTAQRDWRQTSLDDRKTIMKLFVKLFTDNSETISKELSWQMGRPIQYAPGEISGTEERALGMIDLAENALQDIQIEKKGGFNRFIRREPLGIIFVVPAWNYPYLIAANTVVPALLAGNAVILKHSAQTPLCAERFYEAFKKAGLPDGLFQFLHLTHDSTAKVVKDNRIDFVAFTGSVSGGHTIQKIASERFIGVGLELGGKDPAYVRSDANLDFAIENLVDGAFFNSGQSCCGIERIYVHENHFSSFVDGFVDLTNQYILGNPLEQATTLGPMAKLSGVNLVKNHIEQAKSSGAKTLIDWDQFEGQELGPHYIPPQVLINVNHNMGVMMEESFGPVVGIMPVKNDAEAIHLMNDSPFGLTASIWSENEDESITIANQIETGTCFMNRCDYLDPYLSWVGVKDSGRGCSLSQVGFEQLTRPKSYHLRNNTK